MSYTEAVFDSICKVNEFGQEYWSGRELARALGYSDWRNFLNAVFKAMEACENSGFSHADHFGEATYMIKLGKGAVREVDDYHLSRYACYLLVMNGDPKKELIAFGQTYFAVKTRQQELIEDFDQLTEDQRRIAIRAEMRKHNKLLADAAHDAGVKTSLDFAIFQNCGYQGLYGGLKKQDIARRKGLRPSADILDHMGSTELAANLFRATQTEEKIRRDRVQGKTEANRTHFDVGRKVRQTIAELGGVMPEDLPTPDKSVKQLEREQAKLLTDEIE